MSDVPYDAELSFGRDAERLLEQQVVNQLKELDIIEVVQLGDTHRYHVKNTYMEDND